MKKIGAVLLGILAIIFIVSCSANKTTMEKKVKEAARASKDDEVVFSAYGGERELHIVCKGTTAILVVARNDFVYTGIQEVLVLDSNYVICVKK
jgi:hypothetical protein